MIKITKYNPILTAEILSNDFDSANVILKVHKKQNKPDGNLLFFVKVSSPYVLVYVGIQDRVLGFCLLTLCVGTTTK